MTIVTAQDKKLNNIWCWLYIILGIIPYIFLEKIMSFSDKEIVISIVMGIAASIVFVILDKQALSVAGFPAPHMLWGIFLPPVYYYKRARITGERWKCKFWIVSLIYIIGSLLLLLVFIIYVIALLYVEVKVCEFLDSRTELKYGQKGLDTHACESVTFDIMDVDNEGDKPFPTEVLLRNGATLQMDVQILPNGDISIISPYPW